MTAPIEKACPVVLRQRGGVEVLAFVHPRAGNQLVKGTLAPGESADAAAVRELHEEAGVLAARSTGSWGVSADIVAGEVWHFVRVAPPDLPDDWTHWCADDGGHDFAFFWFPLHEAPDERWHPTFVRALAFIREATA